MIPVSCNRPFKGGESRVKASGTDEFTTMGVDRVALSEINSLGEKKWLLKGTSGYFFSVIFFTRSL